jgi:hypothetical protein
MNFCAGLRCTSSTSGPVGESRSTITDAATRASFHLAGVELLPVMRPRGCDAAVVIL